MKIQLSITC